MSTANRTHQRRQASRLCRSLCVLAVIALALTASTQAEGQQFGSPEDFGIQQTALLQTPYRALASDYRATSEAIHRSDIPLIHRANDPSQAFQTHPLYQELVPGNLNRKPRRGFTPIRAQGFEPYFRLNFVYASLSDPQSVVIGADPALFATSGVGGLPGAFPNTPTDPFPAVFNGAQVQLPATSPLPQFGVGSPFTTSGFEFDDASGIEATMGIPLGTGVLEIGGLALQQVDSTVTFRAAAQNQFQSLIPAIRFSNNGAGSTQIAVPFEEVTVRSVADFWGTGLEFQLDPISPNQAYSFAPSIGFKYFKLVETFGVNGFYTDPTAVDPLNPLQSITLFPTLTSESTNHIFGPTFGMRLDLPGPHVSLSLQPRLGLAVNRTITKLDSAQLFVQTQADSRYERESELAPFLEFDANLRIHVNQSLDLFAGYKLLAFSRVRRAEEQIVYDSLGGSANLGINGNQSEVLIHSLMVGGEYTLGRRSTGHPTNNRYR